MKRLLALIGLAGLLLAAAALAGVAQPHVAGAVAPAGPDTVTVTGDGTVTTVPDRAEFTFGVTTRGATAAAALSHNSADMRAVVAALESAGVAERDIQTTQVSLDPVLSQDGQSVVGFTASSSVDVRNLAIATAGSAVDAAVGAGATSVSGPALSTSAQDDLYRQALTAAVARAKAKAETLAAAAGRSLGGVVSIVEGSVQTPILMAPGAAAAGGTSVPIEPGTQKIEATVTVTYALAT